MLTVDAIVHFSDSILCEAPCPYNQASELSGALLDTSTALSFNSLGDKSPVPPRLMRA